jgi:hypothetical protein
MRFSRTIMLTLALALALAGCTDDITGGDNGSGGDFAITVGSGATPTYTWASGPAFSIDVVRTSNETVVVWRVADPNNRAIQSPARHGTVPQGAIELVGIERVLTPGVQYRVTIRLADNSSAFQDFRP